MEDNRQEALNKAKKAQQMMLVQAEMDEADATNNS
jgi:hypothetical protein